MPKVALHTLGCKLNFAETSTLGKQFMDRGFEVVDFGKPADVCVVNTCSVTERADRECRQIIRRALRASPDSFVIVTGCYAQLEPEEVASIDGVDLVLGTKEKFQLFEHATAFEKYRRPKVLVSDIGQAENFGPAFSSTVGDRTRAFLKIQDGCDYNCSFCTIPIARGASRSQSVAATVAQANNLVADGFKEITLTGVNVGDYGKKIGTNLLELLKELVCVEGLERIRISSIEPNLLSNDILGFVASQHKMCKHFHIPLQSGSDDILRRMRRRYTTGMYSDLIHRIHERIPGCGIGADVIVGFPGETEEHFEATYRFLNELPVTYLHAFTYSERPDTPAAGFECVVEPRVRFKRNKMLRILSQKKRQAFLGSMAGKTVDVLLEGHTEKGYRFGFSGNYIKIAVPAAETTENTIVNVHLTGSDHEICIGEVLEECVPV